MNQLGCPIRISTDQPSLGRSPSLFAAIHVLRRLRAPRHPPCALTRLTFVSFLFRNGEHSTLICLRSSLSLVHGRTSSVNALHLLFDVVLFSCKCPGTRRA